MFRALTQLRHFVTAQICVIVAPRVQWRHPRRSSGFSDCPGGPRRTRWCRGILFVRGMKRGILRICARRRYCVVTDARSIWTRLGGRVLGGRCDFLMYVRLFFISPVKCTFNYNLIGAATISIWRIIYISKVRGKNNSCDFGKIDGVDPWCKFVLIKSQQVDMEKVWRTGIKFPVKIMHVVWVGVYK